MGGKLALNKYEDMDPTFSNQREYKFLKELIEAIESSDVDSFTNAVIEYDAITKLDQWKTTLLLRAKKALKDETSGLR